MSRLDHREPLPESLRGAIIALGNFDGFHLGHQAVVGAAVDWARGEGRPVIVATFDPHPMRLFQPDAPPFRLTTLDQREELFADAGADAIATPTWPFAAPRLDAVALEVRGKTVPVDPHRNCFVRAANAIDACAITVPMGLYPSAGVPAGLHFTADRGSESRLLALAGLVEKVLPVLPLAPPLR